MQDVPLKLYLVARWGNNEDGPNGSDTLFVVRAQDYRSAAEVVDNALVALRESKVQPAANWVCEIGEDKGEQTSTAILKGPFYGLSGADGYTSVWTRQSSQDEWISQKAVIEAARKTGQSFGDETGQV